MPSARQVSRTLISLAAAVATGIPAYAAQPAKGSYPDRPIRMLIAQTAGGNADIIARALAEGLSERLGQNVVADNRGGASGIIATELTVRAAPDGYTFIFVFDTHAVNPSLLPKMTFDTLKDLSPVMLVGTAPMAFATAANKPYKNFTEFVTAAKAKPDSLSYGSVGSGSLGHLTMTLVQKAGNFKVIHIPYKGGGPMSADILGGQVESGIGSVAVLASHIKGGKMRALAVTGEARSASMPEVPTMAEQGFPGFSAVAWWGVFAPAGTPKPIIDKLNAEMAKIAKEPAVNKQLTETLGIDLKLSSPEALQAWTVAEMDRWAKVIKENGIKPD